MSGKFSFSGRRPADAVRIPGPGEQRPPILPCLFLAVLIAGCLLSGLLAPGDPYRMDPSAISLAPGGEHPFGTDTMGRDLFACIWYGGRISLAIGILSTLITTAIAVLYGTVSGLVSDRADDVMMRFSEILMSVPQILFVLFLTALAGKGSILSISVAIGVTGWMPIAKMIRSEVRRLRQSGFVMAARTMGAGFFYILRRHLMPNYMASVAYMIISHIGSAIAMEATLSFLGLGLPSNVVSWGSLLSLSQNAALTGAWWLLLIPGAFLVFAILAFTEIGEYMRRADLKIR